MKKYITLLLCLMMLLSLLFSCDTADTGNDTEPNTDSAEPSEQTDGTEHTPPTDASTPYYKIEETGPATVRYSLYDANGSLVFSEETDRPLDISMLGDHVVDIEIGMGTGIAIHTYYDAKANRFSEEYSYVAATSGNLVAYIDTSMKDPMINRVLVVRDIFDKNVFYKSFGLDFSEGVHDPIESAAFTDGEAELEVVYLSERPPIALSATLPIRRATEEGDILSQAEIAMEMYEAALNCDIKVYDTVWEQWIYLDDGKTPYNMIPLNELDYLKYAYTDMDSDSVNELVLDCGDTLILRYYDGTVYLYSFTFRNLYYLNTDGSYAWNHTGSDFEYGEMQIFFEGAKLKTKELYRIVNDGEPNAKYYIADKQVTQEEFLKYIEDHPKTRIEFSPLEVSWLNKISRFEAITLAEKYWIGFNVEENRYIIGFGNNAGAPSSVYVILLKDFVVDHYSTIDEIWIDKTTGEAIIPYAPDGKG